MNINETAKNEKVWKLYKYTCLPNGLIYFGITSQSLKSRWHYGQGYKNNPHLHNAIQKYGEENFLKEIIIDGLSLEEASVKEQEYIAKYNTTDRNIGFNISIGGEATMLGHPVSKETRQKIANTLTGRKMSEKTKRKMAKIGKELYENKREKLLKANTGRPCTQETREKISKGNKGKKRTPEQKARLSEAKKGSIPVNKGVPMTEERRLKQAKPVNQYTLNGEFIKTWTYMKDAAETLNISRNNICSCCQHKRNNAGGYKWEYANQEVHFEDAEDNHEQDQDSDC